MTMRLTQYIEFDGSQSRRLKVTITSLTMDVSNLDISRYEHCTVRHF